MKLRRVDSCCAVVEQQLVAELRDGHEPDIRYFEEVLDGGAAVDVHGPGVCAGLQQHLHQDVIAVPGGLVESCFMVLLFKVGIWNRRKKLLRFLPDGIEEGDLQLEPLTCLVVQQEATN